MKFCLILLIISSFWVYETESGVNLRKGPDNKKKVLTTVPKGQTITILEETNEWWWNVEYQGKTGYIASSFIKKSYPKTILNIVQLYPIGALMSFATFVIILFIRFRKK